MTLVGCLCELLRSGGDFILLRRLWGHFFASLTEEQEPQFALNCSRSETVVSSRFDVVVPFSHFFLFLCGVIFSDEFARCLRE